MPNSPDASWWNQDYAQSQKSRKQQHDALGSRSEAHKKLIILSTQSYGSNIINCWSDLHFFANPALVLENCSLLRRSRITVRHDCQHFPFSGSCGNRLLHSHGDLFICLSSNFQWINNVRHKPHNYICSCLVCFLHHHQRLYDYLISATLDLSLS